MIDISKLEHADVLRALYNAARPLGLGFLHYTPEPMGKEEATDLLKKGDYFDYCKGRPDGRPCVGAELDEYLYDRFNGPDAAAKAITSLRVKLDVEAA